jgi:hypothetical protein
LSVSTDSVALDPVNLGRANTVYRQPELVSGEAENRRRRPVLAGPSQPDEQALAKGMDLPRPMEGLRFKLTMATARRLRQRQGETRRPRRPGTARLWQDMGAHIFSAIQAIGVVSNEKGGVKFVSKKASHSQKPAQSTSTVLQGHGKSSRKWVGHPVPVQTLKTVSADHDIRAAPPRRRPPSRPSPATAPTSVPPRSPVPAPSASRSDPSSPTRSPSCGARRRRRRPRRTSRLESSHEWKMMGGRAGQQGNET